MNFVYVIVASEKNYFLEEAYLSVYSLRKYNPDAYVYWLCDDKTENYIKDSGFKLDGFVNQILVADTPVEFSPVERSRYIKTSVRSLIEGDFLFLDTDTVITTSLNDLNDIKEDISAVLDHHMQFKESFGYTSVVNLLDSIFEENAKEVNCYFNSGVMYVRDTPFAHSFYQKWHENWKYSLSKKCYKDQPSLLRTDMSFGFIINELSGNYNCQVLTSVQYLATAKIIHFFQTKFFDDFDISPFVGHKLYSDIRKNLSVSPKIVDLIVNCKNTFPSPSFLVGYSQFSFLTSPYYSTLAKVFQKNGVWAKFFKLCLKLIK
ncbi:MAG: putative nucleotide-diphospho-sugar transferase [Paludibacteraceae bacterium]|nr:putative nucleotide-diphospho-sugar transferase [Paludibacteraceae bacterium]